MATPSKVIFQAQHNPTTIIRVVAGRDAGDGSKGLDVLLSGVIVLRAYNPADVTTWFQNNSKKNLQPWRDAYHTSGMTEASFKRPTPKNINLAVPYFSQRDNRTDPYGTCNVTNYAMVLAFHHVAQKQSGKYPQFEDELSAFLAANKKDRHVHDDLAWMGRQYGLDCHFGTNRTWDQIRAEIRAGFPVIVSGLFTKSGHIVAVVGTKGDDFIVNDPYGNALSGYQNHDGDHVVYGFDYMNKTVRAGGANAKWAHFIRTK